MIQKKEKKEDTTQSMSQHICFQENYKAKLTLCRFPAPYSPNRSFWGIHSTSLVLLPRLLGGTPENLRRVENDEWMDEWNEWTEKGNMRHFVSPVPWSCLGSPISQCSYKITVTVHIYFFTTTQCTFAIPIQKLALFLWCIHAIERHWCYVWVIQWYSVYILQQSPFGV